MRVVGTRRAMLAMTSRDTEDHPDSRRPIPHSQRAASQNAGPEPGGFPETLSFPASGDMGDDASVWSHARTLPTSLLAMWPGDAAPSARDVTDRFARFVGSTVAVLEELPSVDPSVAWSRVLAVPGLAAPVVVWVEPAQDFPSADLPDPRIARCRWVIGCQTILGAPSPLDDFIALMRLLAGSLERVFAVIDLTTRQWFLDEEIEIAFLRSEALATEDMLWRVRAVSRSEVNAPDDPVWVYTEGLARCGCPELEILELPHRHLATGVALLNGIAALALAAPLPRPGTVAAVGENLRVAFRPWQEVAEFIHPDAVGSTADRRAAGGNDDPNPLLGIRAAVCDPEPRGSFRRIWAWPQHAIRQLESGKGAIYLSDRSTLQLARRARATWPQFVRAYESLDAATAAFLVKVPFANASEPDRGREHLWFAVRDVEGERVDGILLNDPQLATHLVRGNAVSFTAAEISDWRVEVASRSHGPSSADELDGTVSRILDGP